MRPYRLIHDVEYAAPVGRGHLLDLYVPVVGDGPYPVVVYQAGSAFLSDDSKARKGSAELAARCAAQGFAVVGLNTRSSRQAVFPAQVHDVKAAIRYLRANAEEYRLDRERFAAMGTSSGGWAAAMAGTTGGVRELDGDLGNARESSRVRAVVDLFGPTDFAQMDAHRMPDGLSHDPVDSPESLLMGFPLRSDPAAVQRANPAAYVTADSPPIWIAHGVDDSLVPAYESELLFAAYEQAGATATLTLVPNTGHTDAYLADPALSAGRIVKRTAGGRTTVDTRPAPTFEVVLDFLRVSLDCMPGARRAPTEGGGSIELSTG